MNRSHSRQHTERGRMNNERKVNVRAKLPPSSTPVAEELAQQIDDVLSIRNSCSIDDFTSRDFYYDTDSYYRFHEQLLKDREYVKSWHSAICSNPHLFKDKVSFNTIIFLPKNFYFFGLRSQIVLDVRCGLGLLSMFAAIAGAKHVYAIDKSNVVQMTRRVIRDNRLADKITVIQGSAVDINLPIDKVDIIISTVFVTSLFYDNSFEEIIVARDKWLSTKGLMFPDRCNLYIAAFQDKEHSQANSFWQNVYDFSMSPMLEVVNSQPSSRRIRSSEIFTNACPFKQIDFHQMTKAEWDHFAIVFRLKVKSQADEITALFTFLELEFSECHTPVKISTRPGSKIVNWLPTVFYLNCRDIVPVERRDLIYGSLVFDGKNKQKPLARLDLCYRNQRGFIRDEFHYEFR